MENSSATAQHLVKKAMIINEFKLIKIININSQIKITRHIFPAKIYSRVNILLLKFATQIYCTKKSCLFNHNLSLSFRNDEILVYCLKITMYFYCIYSIKMKLLLMLGTGYFLKITKINSQQEKPICPNCKNQFPQNTKRCQSAKIDSCKIFMPHSMNVQCGRWMCIH